MKTFKQLNEMYSDPLKQKIWDIVENHPELISTITDHANEKTMTWNEDKIGFKTHHRIRSSLLPDIKKSHIHHMSNILNYYDIKHEISNNDNTGAPSIYIPVDQS